MKQIPALTPKSNILPLWQDITNQPKVQLDKLAIHNKASIRFIDFDDILYCKADSNYTEIHLQSGEKVITSVCLKSVESKITSKLFVRIHKSYLVNLAKMTELIKINGWQMRIGDVLLPIARVRVEYLKGYLGV